MWTTAIDEAIPAEFRERANCGVGAVVHLRGDASHQVLDNALEILERMEHRGACGADDSTGDGAGVMLRKPDLFFRHLFPDLPPDDAYGVGQFFLPRREVLAAPVRTLLDQLIAGEGFQVIAWRPVPTDNTGLGEGALRSEPAVYQVLVADVSSTRENALDHKLFLLLRVLEHALNESTLPGAAETYICSFDRRRIVYKGLLKNTQLRSFYPDLGNPLLETPFALVHSRFSTNTLGSWSLAHPYRTLVHNGEINTYRGNLNRLRMQEGGLGESRRGAAFLRIRPLAREGGSDTALLDNVLELLMAGGRSLPHALRMLIPEAWQKDSEMSQEQRDWYDFHSTIMEPWDGPALVVATDGRNVAAVLDRNGFRPCRFDITRDDRLILASEVGVLDVSPHEIVRRGRLQPGEMLFADPGVGRVRLGEDVFADLTSPRYGRWLTQHRVRLADIALPRDQERGEILSDLEQRQCAAGYTLERIERWLRPMADDGKDPMGAMGDDAPPALLSSNRRPLFDYFKQLFAQVSNPPIDYMREDLVMSLESHVGPQGTFLKESPEHCRRIHLGSPILTNGDLNGMLWTPAFRTRVLDMTFAYEERIRDALTRLCLGAEAAIADGIEVLVISDRRAGSRRLALPSLLAVGSLHQHLIRIDKRLRCGLVVEAADACTVHHMSLLLGFGADAINPYLALASVEAIGGGDVAAVQRYLHALDDGLLKVMSKMGISALEGYKGAQLFEALGLNKEIMDRSFAGTASRIGGVGFEDLEADVRHWHSVAYETRLAGNAALASGGELYWRRDGEHHDWSPDSLSLLQASVRTRDERLYRAFSQLIDRPADGAANLRGLLRLCPERPPLALDEVEPVANITRRFFTGAMSLGALSPEAHETLAIGMNRVGGVAHSGEGGEPESRRGTERECRNKQVASGRFGVTAAYLAHARQLEIKMAQGAKPGEGGQLPGDKVDSVIAALRHTTPGIDLVSPPPHHDIYSIEDLAQLIHDLRCASPRAEIHVKLVSEAGVGTIAAGVVKAGADAILIAGDSGGTGAASKTSIKSAGLPWELGLAETQRVLVENRLRSRVRLRVDGGLKTGRDVLIAAALGAEQFGFGMAALVTIGCIMLRKCHCNTCSVGIATQDPELRKRFPGKPEHVVNYMNFVAAEVREGLAELGLRRLDDLVGRVDLLRHRRTGNARDDALDLSALLHGPVPNDFPRWKPYTMLQRRADTADRALINASRLALRRARAVTVRQRVTNRDRSVGARLSYEVVRRYGSGGLAPGTIDVEFSGSAGQSFGAFVAPGIALTVEGAANDYVGKGLSGGRIAVRPPHDAGYAASSILIGNAALYGATAGELYVAGGAGERFAVRNSGALAVVETVGDHACEYMTGGAVVILGSTGRNLAAGMSGGEIFLFAEDAAWTHRLNYGTLRIVPLEDPRDRLMLERMLRNHQYYTHSVRAKEIIDRFQTALRSFVKLVPARYADIVRQRLAAGEDLRTPPPPPANTVSEAMEA